MTSAFSVRRVLALLLAVLLMMSCFAGCKKSRTTLPPTEPTHQIPETTEPEVTEAPTTEPVVETTEATEAPTEAPATEPSSRDLTGTVVGNYVNLRTGPGTNYGSSSALKDGTPVVILELELDGVLPWGRLEEGWVRMDYVKLDYPDDVLAYDSTAAVGIIMHDGAWVYDGPGSFYDQSVLVAKNTRVNVFSFFGNWCRIDEGWILKDHIYFDGKPGPNAAVMGTVKAGGVFLRSGPGTEYGINTAYSAGARVKILYRTTIRGVDWGCLEGGWVCLDYVLVDGDPAAAILGTWYGHTMQSMDQIDHTFSEWNFYIDGTYSRTKWYYNENSQELSKFQDGHSAGKYTFDGTKLVLDGSECAAYIDGGKLYINEGNGMKAHVKTSMQAAIDAFLAEKYPPAPETPPAEGGETPPEGGSEES